jgi:nucleoside-diphosphate-sugar epimerase
VQVLVTGHRGSIGATVTEHLRRRGYAINGFDVADGDDLLDLDARTRAAGECAAIVHLGALPRDTAGPPEKIMAVNVLGTWHALLAAEEARASRVVHFSSAQVFGFAEGEGSPDYFPVDDHHPRRAKRPYGLSKRLAEDLGQAFSERTGLPSVCLRPVWVCHPEDYKRVEEQRRADPSSEWEPYWARGGFVDVRDVADAVARALEVPLEGHHRAILCAADIAGSPEYGGIFCINSSGLVTSENIVVEGEDLPPTNFVVIDRTGATWFTVMTRLRPRFNAWRRDVADGFIGVRDGQGARIVADGLGYANEIAFSPDGRWVYVNETYRQRVSRFRRLPGNELGDRETVAELRSQDPFISGADHRSASTTLGP